MSYPKNKKHPSAKNIDVLRLETSHHPFKEIFDNAKDPMLAIFNDGAIHCFVNRSACELTGYNLEELMNMGFKDLVHPEELGKIEDRLEKQRNGIDCPSCYKTRIVTKNGDIIPVEVTVTIRVL